MELLRLKKMLSKYSYFKDEFNETEFLFKEYSNSFNNSFGIAVIPKVLPEVLPEVLHEVLHEVLPEVLHEVLPEPKSDFVNKLYRKLSLLTHPDKKGGSAEIFNQVHTEYIKGNTIGLLLLAHSYNLEILDYFEYYSETDFNNDIKMLSDSSARIKSSLAWVWQSADLVKRQELRTRFGF